MWELEVTEYGLTTLKHDGKPDSKTTRLEIRAARSGEMNTATMDLFWDDGLNLEGVLVPEYGLPVGRIPFALRLPDIMGSTHAWCKIDGEEYHAWDVVVTVDTDIRRIELTVQMGDRSIRIAGQFYGTNELDDVGGQQTNGNSQT